jgi:MerR family transcriptional regulator, light-induced transcriptional regulator
MINETLLQYKCEFEKLLFGMSKVETVDYALMLLSSGKTTVRELYEEILAPALNNISINREEESQQIWKEHLATNTVRSIIECAYPYVMQVRSETLGGGTPKKVIVLCPEEEYHELGARMGADFFTMAGCDVFYIGSNTPRDNFISAYKTLHPDIIAISVTNYLNLVSLKKIISELRAKVAKDVLIVVSGSALSHARKTAKDFNADRLILTFEDVKAMGREQQ